MSETQQPLAPPGRQGAQHYGIFRTGYLKFFRGLFEMIVLHEEKIIFLKARKAAGSSFEVALARYAKQDDIITPIGVRQELIRKDCGFRGPQNYKYGFLELSRLGPKKILGSLVRRKIPAKYWSHIPAAELYRALGDDTWSRYKKIAIIRNPFEYMVSFYFWRMKDKNDSQWMCFQDFVLSNPELILWNKEIYEIDGCDIVDFYIRFEEMKVDIASIEAAHPRLGGLGAIFNKLSLNGSVRPPKASTESMFRDAPEAATLIYNLTRDDIEKYGWALPY